MLKKDKDQVNMNCSVEDTGNLFGSSGMEGPGVKSKMYVPGVGKYHLSQFKSTK